MRSLVEAWGKLQREPNAQITANAFAAAAQEITVDKLTSLTPNQVISDWQKRKLSQATIATRRKYIRQILRWLEAEGAPRNIEQTLTKVRQPRPRAVIASPEEIERLILAARPWMRVWLAITAGHGLRFAEARRLCAANFNASNGTITYRTKGESTNSLPANEDLKRFFRVAPPCDDPNKPLIEIYFDQERPSIIAEKSDVGRPIGEVLQRDYIYKCWFKLKKLAGVNMELRPHDLRRTLAVRTYDLTHDLRTVQQLLGHSNMQTTTTYLEHRDPEKMREVLNALGTNYSPKPTDPHYPRQLIDPKPLN